MVNNHGDCEAPKDQVVGPLPNDHLLGEPETTIDVSFREGTTSSVFIP